MKVSIPHELPFPRIGGLFTTSREEHEIMMHFITRRVIDETLSWIRTNLGDLIVGGDTDSIYIKKPTTLIGRWRLFTLKRRIARFNKNWPSSEFTWSEWKT